MKRQQKTGDINELALFAGAGGGLLASSLLGWKTVCAVEIDWYCRCILTQRQNERMLETFPIWDDVCTFNSRPWRRSVDVISGGFPCQAYSTAASGNNTADTLWPEMRRIVADVAPRYVFAENVSKEAINFASEECKSMGYETKAISLSAKDMGADHERKRHWLLAYADDPRKLLRGLNAETSFLSKLQTGVWKSYSGESRVFDGMAYRMDRLKATGNGQVPQVAVAALWSIVNA